jgi:hypothetical protein
LIEIFFEENYKVFLKKKTISNDDIRKENKKKKMPTPINFSNS